VRTRAGETRGAAALPHGIVPYRRTAIFDEVNLPAGLRREHRTRTGVWGRIVVLEGRLRYCVLDPVSDCVLDPETPGIIMPQQPHRIEPLGAVRFYIEFLAAADGIRAAMAKTPRPGPRTPDALIAPGEDGQIELIETAPRQKSRGKREGRSRGGEKGPR